jgi:hypothetical protein
MKKKAPKVKDLKKAKQKIEYMISTYGHKRYKKRRRKCARVVEAVLKKYNIKGTISEEYWRLAYTCWMIGEL